MRINLNQTAQPLAESERNHHQCPAASPYASSPLAEDQTQSPCAHTQIQALAARANALPEVRQGKISALRQAISSGSYGPSSEQVAEGLFSHMVNPAAA
jgi:flagellar biosynthesis anti-sigma factor FlgM